MLFYRNVIIPTVKDQVFTFHQLIKNMNTNQASFAVLLFPANWLTLTCKLFKVMISN